ncbi:MAG: nucleotidyltransferase [Planctomycetia bacterium]|nr:nucleotidyltransferase [Planctomycetia bacterium]
MKLDEYTLAVVDALNAENLPYLVVGSLSSNYYGIPRATEDADFFIDLESGSLSWLVARLGPEFRLDPQLTFETATGTTRAVVRVAQTAFKIELFKLGGDAHDQERFARRRRIQVAGRDVYLPTPEDVIITKLRWARKKDLEDVRDVIAVQGDAIDWDYVYRWCDVHGTRERLEQIRREIPKI